MANGFSRNHLIELINDISEPVVSGLGLEIWGIEVLGGGRTLVRIFVDFADAAAAGDSPETASQDALMGDEPGFASQSGVTVNQCAEISRLVGLALEVEEAFPNAWTLEVSSPGLERSFFRLDQLNRYLGEEIDVILWRPLVEVPLRKKYRGIVREVGADAFSLELSEVFPDSPPGVRIEWDAVRKASLRHAFPDTNKPGTGK